MRRSEVEKIDSGLVAALNGASICGEPDMTGSMEARRTGVIKLVDGDFWYVRWNSLNFAISLHAARGIKLEHNKPITFIGRLDGKEDWEATELKELYSAPSRKTNGVST